MANDDVQWKKFYFILKSMSKWYTFSSVFPGYIEFGKDHIPEDNATKNVKNVGVGIERVTHEHMSTWAGEKHQWTRASDAHSCRSRSLCYDESLPCLQGRTVTGIFRREVKDLLRQVGRSKNLLCMNYFFHSFIAWF